jgi:hypothetical protein
VELDPARLQGTPGPERTRPGRKYTVTAIPPDAVQAVVLGNEGAYARFAADPVVAARFDFDHPVKTERGWRVERRPLAPAPAEGRAPERQAGLRAEMERQLWRRLTEAQLTGRVRKSGYAPAAVPDALAEMVREGAVSVERRRGETVYRATRVIKPSSATPHTATPFGGNDARGTTTQADARSRAFASWEGLDELESEPHQERLASQETHDVAAARVDGIQELDARLHSLPEPALKFWSDAETRAKVFKDLLRLHRAKISAERQVGIQQTLGFIHQAVSDALGKLDYPVGTVKEVRVKALEGSKAKKYPSCELAIDEKFLADQVRNGDIDGLVRTYVQECVHARKKFATNYKDEYFDFPGYEEGTAEVIARFVTIQGAGMRPRLKTYAHYHRAFSVLAERLGVSAEDVARSLAAYPPGRIRENFAREVERFFESSRGRRFTDAELDQVGRSADVIFARKYRAGGANVPLITGEWEKAIPDR